jgi:multidrug resistance efflux pump
MSAERLKPIPVPLAERWRDARLRLIPICVFGGSICAVALLWKEHVAPASMVGQAEPVIANVSSHKPGILAELSVARFQKVKVGDPIGQVMITDPNILASSIAVIRSEIESLRVSLQPIASEQKRAIGFDRLQLDWMRERADLAATQVKLQQAQSEFRRVESLYKDQIVSQKLFEQTRSSQDSLQKEVDELTKLVCEAEKNLQVLQVSNKLDAASVSEEPLHAAIAVQEAKLRQLQAELSPILLKAPMDGIITTLFHRTGEAVMAGQPVVSIATFNPVRIVGYMKPPILEEPKIGMKIEVRVRSPHREVGFARVIEVGTQLENVPAALLGAAKLGTAELGLPLDISLPSNLKLRAGELVDLVLQPNRD